MLPLKVCISIVELSGITNGPGGLNEKTSIVYTQIISILNEADAGVKVKDICRKHGISDAAYYNRKSKYGGMSASKLKRMKEMAAEPYRHHFSS